MNDNELFEKLDQIALHSGPLTDEHLATIETWLDQENEVRLAFMEESWTVHVLLRKLLEGCKKK